MRKAFAILILPMLAACAPRTVPWTNPDVPRDQWSSDYSACRRYADRDVGWRDDDRDTGSVFRDYDRAQAKKRFDGIVANCMIDRGYVPASRSKE